VARRQQVDAAKLRERTLVKKVEEMRFPSTEMLNRLDRLVARLEQLERQLVRD